VVAPGIVTLLFVLYVLLIITLRELLITCILEFLRMQRCHLWLEHQLLANKLICRLRHKLKLHLHHQCSQLLGLMQIL
jgi:hypothetical protein